MEGCSHLRFCAIEPLTDDADGGTTPTPEKLFFQVLQATLVAQHVLDGVLFDYWSPLTLWLQAFQILSQQK